MVKGLRSILHNLPSIFLGGPTNEIATILEGVVGKWIEFFYERPYIHKPTNGYLFQRITFGFYIYIYIYVLKQEAMRR